MRLALVLEELGVPLHTPVERHADPVAGCCANATNCEAIAKLVAPISDVVTDLILMSVPGGESPAICHVGQLTCVGGRAIVG